MTKNRLYLYLELFLPSILGTVVYLMMAAAVFFESYNTKNNQLLNGFNNIFKNNHFIHELSHYWHTVINSTIANAAALWTFWILVGIAVCLIGYFFISNLEQFGEALNERKYIWPKASSANRPLIEFFIRNLFRVIVAIGLFIYCKWLINFVLTSLNSTSSLNGHIIVIIKDIILFHILIILLRLFFLRRRLFSNNNQYV